MLVVHSDDIHSNLLRMLLSRGFLSWQGKFGIFSIDLLWFFNNLNVHIEGRNCASGFYCTTNTEDIEHFSLGVCFVSEPRSMSHSSLCLQFYYPNLFNKVSARHKSHSTTAVIKPDQSFCAHLSEKRGPRNCDQQLLVIAEPRWLDNP